MHAILNTHSNDTEQWLLKVHSPVLQTSWCFITPANRIINLRHRRWTEVTVFTPVCLFVRLFVNSITEKLLDGFRRNLVGGLGLVQGSCHSILDLVQSPIWPLWRPFWKNIWIFVFAFLHVLSDFQPKKKCWRKKKGKFCNFFSKKFRFYLKNIWIFFLHFYMFSVISNKKHAKIIIAADFGTSGGYTHVKSISVSRNLVMTNELSM